MKENKSVIIFQELSLLENILRIHLSRLTSRDSRISLILRKTKPPFYLLDNSLFSMKRTEAFIIKTKNVGWLSRLRWS